MKTVVIHGAALRCSEGTSPGALTVVREKIASHELPVATVMDFAPMMNIAPFGMCRSQANPQVAAATAAAMGVPTPQPCLPVTTSPWSPGASKVKVGEDLALSSNSKCSCAWSGNIEITTSKVSDVEVS